MKKLYCKSCGGGSEYTLTRPKFCNNCGKSMAGVAGHSCPAGHKGKPGVPGQLEIEEESDEITTIPQISELQVETSTSVNKGIKIEDLWATVDPDSEQAPDSDIPFDRGRKNPQQSQEEFLRDFQKEAGTLRNNIPDRGD